MSSAKIYKICLVGCGIAGSILLLKLLETIPPEEICVIDPAFDGGDLGRRWSEVTANSTWGNFIEFMGKLAVAKPFIEKRKDKYPSDTITPVWELSNGLRQALSSSLKNMDVNTCYAKRAHYDTDEKVWKIQMDSPGCMGQRRAKLLIYAPGGNPRQVNLSKYQIPLEIALDLSRLKKSVEGGQHILLFGLAHSGTLVLKNLLQLGVQVSAIYRGENPFIFQRDGYYNGIKQETAKFADKLLANPSSLVTFIKSNDAEATIRAYTKCDAIISAIGFSKNTKSIEVTVDSNIVDMGPYNNITGAIENAPAETAFGFGMAYPSFAERTEGAVTKFYEKAGVESFVTHLDSVVPAILSSQQLADE